MTTSELHILFVCTSNAALSPLAEAALHALGGARWQAYSAGSSPTGKVHPYAIRMIEELGFPLGRLRSKSWNEYKTPDSQVMDAIILLSDAVPATDVTQWPGQPLIVRWPHKDPTHENGTGEANQEAFTDTLKQLLNGVLLMTMLPVVRLGKDWRPQELLDIGRA